MGRPKSVIAAAIAAAICIAALAAPAAAANSRIVIVNGIAGKKVDVCLNGAEVKSGLGYGGRIVRTLADGSYVLKVFAKNTAICSGTKLAQKTITLASDDLTVVATKSAPKKVVVFDNADINAATGPTQASIVFRHAADLGDATFHAQLMVPKVSPGPSLAADPVWAKTNEYSSIETTLWGWDVYVTRPNEVAELASAKIRTIQAGRRHEWLLLGKTEANAKVISYSRPTSAPAP